MKVPVYFGDNKTDIDISFQLSPSDIPNSIYINTQGISFIYPFEEKDKIEIGDSVIFAIGHDTGRLYHVNFNNYPMWPLNLEPFEGSELEQLTEKSNPRVEENITLSKQLLNEINQIYGAMRLR